MARRTRSRSRNRKRSLRLRNPLALPTRRLGHRVKASLRTYRRRAKHRRTEES